MDDQINSLEQSKFMQTKRIMIIDDEPFNVISMQLTLSGMGIKGLASLCDRAYNGLEALTKIKEAYNDRNHIYGLIFTDISMPVMDGYEASEEIRQFYE